MELAVIYVERRQATLAQWLALRFLFEVCAREIWCKGGGKSKQAWWRKVLSEKQFNATPADSQKAKRRRIGWEIGKQQEPEGRERAGWEVGMMVRIQETPPGGQMTLCGRWRFWVGDGGRPGGRMNLCGSYGGDQSSRKGKVEYIAINDRVQGLSSHWQRLGTPPPHNLVTLLFSGYWLTHKHTIKYSTYFVCWNFAFKVCNTAWIVPSFVILFSFLFLGGFKMKYSIDLEDGIYTFQLLFSCALKVNLQKRVHNFHTKISYSTRNYVKMVKISRIRRLNTVIFNEKNNLIPESCQ